MRRTAVFGGLVAAGLVLVVVPVRAGELSPAIAPLGFLVGHWQSVSGHAEHGMIDRGTVTIEPAAGGAALLRRDHTELFAADGKPAGSFEQIMLIYPEAGGLRADYFDGTHAIHYRKITVQPGLDAQFLTDAAPGPDFRLDLARRDATHLAITFEIRPPGAPGWHTIAAGEVVRAGQAP